MEGDLSQDQSIMAELGNWGRHILLTTFAEIIIPDEL